MWIRVRACICPHKMSAAIFTIIHSGEEKINTSKFTQENVSFLIEKETFLKNKTKSYISDIEKKHKPKTHKYANK